LHEVFISSAMSVWLYTLFAFCFAVAADASMAENTEEVIHKVHIHVATETTTTRVGVEVLYLALDVQTFELPLV